MSQFGGSVHEVTLATHSRIKNSDVRPPEGSGRDEHRAPRAKSNSVSRRNYGHPPNSARPRMLSALELRDRIPTARRLASSIRPSRVKSEPLRGNLRDK